MEAKKPRRPRKTKKPKAKYPGVSPVWSGGTWKWRARPKFNGRQEWGPVRESEEQAQNRQKG